MLSSLVDVGAGVFGMEGGETLSVFPRTRPSYPSRTTQASQLLLREMKTHNMQVLEADLRIAAFTTERTTAFIPALSPPEVNIAIFMVME